MAGQMAWRVCRGISWSTATARSRTIRARWMRSIAPQATVATRSDHWQGLILAVKAGAGLAALPHFQGDCESELVRVIDDIGLVLPIHMLLHRDMQHAPRVRPFADFVASEIKAFRAILSGPVSGARSSKPAALQGAEAGG